MKPRVVGMTTGTEEKREELRRLRRNPRLKQEVLFRETGGLVLTGDRVGRHRLMSARQAGIGVRAMARLLGVSRSGYYP